VEAEREELARAVRELRVSIQNRELLTEVQRSARRLHDLLIGPVEDLLKDGQTLGVVPHRGLHYLSFASLYDGEAFLVERHPLFYGPSASVLYRTWRSPPASDAGEPKVLAVGNPETGNPAFELPFTEREVVSISRDFREVSVVTGHGASEEWVKANMGDFDVVHIGAHGYFEPLNPLFSGLMLSPGEQDGLLHLYEVTGLRLNARLVTLSACQSGVGELRSGDDLVSLSRAFFYAGTRSILSTLWRVDDVSTALVTKHFYRHYVDHGAAVSLRHAQLQVMNDGRHFHPSYWAGLVLSGDWR
jgi:CHAT domain-containing protein